MLCIAIVVGRDISIEDRSISILMPALNEEEVIGKTLDRIPIADVEVIVIDNGSTDRTAEIANEFGAKVIYQPIKGYGAACLAGIGYLKSKANPPDLVVFLDADGTDDPNNLFKLIDAKLSEPFPDMVMGNRLNDHHVQMSIHAELANKVFSALIRMLYGVKLYDMGPFRIIDFDTLLELDMSDHGYGWAAEMIVKALKYGYSIKEVDIKQRPRFGQSKISGSVLISLKAAISLTIHIFKHSI